ncbi:PQQ-binding-like beta-propeller repeat protein [Streptomyces decoyicus]|uniref:outer membrane protein assembly factor BamB family protein n=1 Tax=Streptomyces decoyicus TaxID=249567 RepID=UPI00362D3103
MTADGMPGAQGPAGQQPQAPPPSGGVPWQKAGPQQGYGFPQQAPPPAQGHGSAPFGQPVYGAPQQPPPPPAGGVAPGYGGAPGHQAAPGPLQSPPAPFPAQGQYPAQVPYGAPVPPPAQKGKAGLIVLLVVALVVLSGAGVGAWYLLAGPSSDDAVLWSQPSYKGGKRPPGEMSKEVEGTWITDKTVVQTLPGGVKAYDVATGKRMWATPLPGDSNTVCAAPSQSAGGIGIVAYGEAGACDHLVAYDLGSGKQMWTKGLKKESKAKPGSDGRFEPGDSGAPDTRDASYARSGDVVIAQVWGTTQALKISDGSPAWEPEESGKCGGAGEYTGGKALIRVRNCSTKPLDGVQYDEVSLIDPATGKAKWTYTFRPEKGRDNPGMSNGGDVISTDPVVLYPEREDMGLIALDNRTGKLRSRFSPHTPAEYVQSQSPEGTPWMEDGAFGSTFVVGASEGSNKGQLLAAYDLDSGALLWKTKAEKSRDYYPLPGAVDGKILAYARNNSKDKGPELVEYDRKTGTPHTVVEYPAEVDEGLDLSARPYWRDGRLYMTAIGSADMIVGTKTYAMVALKLHQ